MATLRDLGLTPRQAADAAPAPTLRDLGLAPRVATNVMPLVDEASANSMGQLRRGFTTGLLGSDANALAADESALRAAGRTAEADDLLLRRQGIQQRMQTFAPAEQDVTKLEWSPGRVLDYGLGAAGQGAASMLEPAGAAAALGAASRVAEAVPGVPGVVAKGLRLAAPGAALYLGARQAKGEFYGDASQDAELMRTKTAQEIDTAGNVSGAIGGALDAILPAAAGLRIAGRPLTSAMAGRGLLARTALDSAGEVATEVAQGEVKRGTLGILNPDRDTSGDTDARWNDAAGGFFGALPMSAASNLASNGHARTKVADDLSSDDVSGRATPAPAAPSRMASTLADQLHSTAKKNKSDDAAEEWNSVLKNGSANPADAVDVMATTPVRHEALLKELTGRAEKGDAIAAQHADTLRQMDPNDPTTWLDDTPRDAAYEHLLGDGTDHAKVIAAYEGRKLNEQGFTPQAKLAADIMRAELPETVAPQVRQAAGDIARQIADFAQKAAGRGKLRDPLTVMEVAQKAVDVFGGKKAAAVVAKAAVAAGVETSPLFKQLQQNIAGAADINAWKNNGRASRAGVGDQLIALIPPEKQLALRAKGVDLTSRAYKLALVDTLQQFGDRHPVQFNEAFGKDATAQMLALVAPGKVVEKDTAAVKRSGGEKTEAATESDEVVADPESQDGESAGEITSRDVDNAKKNVERAPGTKMYVFKGRSAVGSDEAAHPFRADRKTGNLPTLSALDDKDSDGTPTLERMAANAFDFLGGSTNDPSNAIPSATKGELGVGSHRIRTASAREVMDDSGVSPSKRVELMLAYIAKNGEKIDTTPESLREKLGVTVPEDATTLDMANAYFGSRFLVVAEQMAEKDQLRLSPAEVRTMVRAGVESLKYTDQFRDGKVEAQASLNLIRFKSEKAAVSKNGIAVIRANDLVEWVHKNRNEFNKPSYNGDEALAREFRDALMEGIGALAADGYITKEGGLPYMLNAAGKAESFANGFPPSLRLSTMTQAEMTQKAAGRAKQEAKKEGPPRRVLSDQEQFDGSTDSDRAAARDEDRTARRSPEGDGIPNELRNQGAERGAADRKVGQAAPGERFWDAPELVDDRTGRNRVPSELEAREQTSGVPTDRTDLAQRTAALDTDPVERGLTPANVGTRAQRLADGILARFSSFEGMVGGRKVKSDVPADPRGAVERLRRVVAALNRPTRGEGSSPAGGKLYALPLALTLTPQITARMVAAAKDGPKAQAMLSRMRDQVALALQTAQESELGLADRVRAARALLNNDTLSWPMARAALAPMAAAERARMAAEDKAKADAEAEAKAKADAVKAKRAEPAKPTAADRVDARVMAEDYTLTIKQVEPFLKAARARLDALEKARKDNDYENLSDAQEQVLARLRALFDEASDLAPFYRDAPGWDDIPHSEKRRLLTDAEAMIVGAKRNAQATTAAPATEAQIAEAKAYITKVLGPQVKVAFSDTMGYAGEWINAEQTIRLSTAIGPGVLSVAHHEATHAFWSRLAANNERAQAVLARTFSDPAMLERLKALLHNEPEALAAITSGRHAQEERVAYGYQFWAAGLLDVDKPATTLFSKVRKFLRKVLGMVRDSESAADLMTALHEGKLAEPSAAGRVIDDIMKDATWNEDAKRKFDKQIQGAFAAVAPSNDVLRKEVLSETAQRLGMSMFTNPGEENAGKFKNGYINDRVTKTRQYTNYLYDAVKGLSARDMEDAAKQLQLKTPLASIPYAPVRDAVKAVRALTRRYYDYATNDAGMVIEYLGDDHYPRVWSLNTLIEDGGKDKFAAMLKQPKYATKLQGFLDQINSNSKVQQVTLDELIDQLHSHLVEKNGVDEDGLSPAPLSGLLTPFFASGKERSFKWLDDADVEPFLEKDLVGAMSRYLHQGIRAAEYDRRFGNDKLGPNGSDSRGRLDLKEALALKGDEWTNPETDRKENRASYGIVAAEMERTLKERDITGKEADVIIARHMEDIRNSVEAHEGSLGRDISPTWRKWSSAAMAYQNLRLLPLSLFAAFGDTMGIVARGGGAKAGFEAFTQGLKDVYARWKDAASDMPAARTKTMWEDIAEMVGAVDSHMFLEQLGKAHTSEFMTDFARRSNRALFMVNGLTAWDRSMRVSGTKAAVLFIQHHASLPDEQHSARWLAELGLEPAAIPLDKQGKLIVDRHVLAAEKGIDLKTATELAERVHRAVVRWVEGAVLTPNAGQRPTWASDPHYAVLFHLKQFTYSFHHTILKRAFNEARQGNMNPMGALAAAIPTMIAADVVKGLVVGGGSLPSYMKAWDAGDWVLHGASRAGLAGIGQFGIDALRDPLSLLGPTADQIGDFVLNPTDLGHNLHNAIPGARMVKDIPDMVRVV